MWRQYIDYWSDLLHGDLRISTKYRNRTVAEILAQTLPVTLTLGSLAFLLALGCGISLGALAATHPYSSIDHAALFFVLLAVSLPTFILGPLLILIFCIHGSHAKQNSKTKFRNSYVCLTFSWRQISHDDCTLHQPNLPKYLPEIIYSEAWYASKCPFQTCSTKSEQKNFKMPCVQNK